MQNVQSKLIFQRMSQCIPGGVNSPIRSFSQVNCHPLVFKQGKGCEIIDSDNNRYIDYVLSWGPLVLGHAPDDVNQELLVALEEGISFGACHPSELQLAELIIKNMPSMEMLRFVSSGTEACMSAIRLARGYTKRLKIVKFAGCYHGHSDGFLAQAGSGVASHSSPTAPGVNPSVVADTIVLPFNNEELLQKTFQEYGETIAGVIVEPVAANMGLVLPTSNFLHNIENLCKSHGALFILDEVIMGFRASLGGAQAVYDLDPDLTCLGKVIGGGMPVGAFGGKKHIMQHLSPLGPIFQAGTLSGNPLCMRAGIATLTALVQGNVFAEIKDKTSYFVKNIQEIILKRGMPFTISQIGTVFGFFFLKQSVAIENFEQLQQNLDKNSYSFFFNNMLKQGVYFAPSPYEVGFLSRAHEQKHLDFTLEAFEKTIRLM